MTTDERLDRLTERNEALAQSLEIIAGMQEKNEKAIAELTAIANIISTAVLDHQRRLDNLDNPGNLPPS